jgi:hypothetical protein
MLRKTILCALAASAMIPATAYAQRGHGGGGPPAGVGGIGNAGGLGMGGPGGMGGLGGMSGMGSSNGMGNVGVDTRSQGRVNSQGPVNASATGIAHANGNSVLAGTSTTSRVRAGTLTGLSNGQTIFSNGTAIGTVQQIRTSGNGSVAMVVVKGSNGALYAVPAAKLSMSGGMLSTTARFNGINGSADVAARAQARLNSQGPTHASATGIAHANSRSVLAGASGSALGGVSVGMPLFQGGAQVGSVYRVVTANGVITRVLVQGTNGRIYSLAPNSIVASGGNLTTTATLRGI